MDTRTGAVLEQNKPRASDWSPGGIWHRLTAPPDEVLAPELRRRMRFLASLLVLLVPLALLGVILSHVLATPWLTVQEDPVLLTGLSIDAVLLVAYGLSRSAKYYTIGAATSLVAIAIGTVATAVLSPGDAATLLVFFSLVTLLASLLLPVSGTIVLAVIVNLAALPLPALVPAISVTVVINVLAFNVIMSTLIIVSAVIRQRDLAQIEDQAHRLADAIRLAEETNRLKSQFLATMSHELRTPLNAIIGFAEVMMMGLAGKLDPQALRTTERIHHNSERLLGLIDDLLDISKIEAGRLEMVHQPFAPGNLLKDVERATKPQALERGLEFVARVDPSLPPALVGDSQRLEQIMLNLVTNAIKFTDKGTVSLAMLPVDADKWCIEVADTGVGIPAHAQEFIFEKFRQVDGSSRRAYGGAGLGLAIVKELTVLMEGAVKVQSKVGVGSTFTVILPKVIPGKGHVPDGQR